MVDEDALQSLRSTLAADGYGLEVREDGDRVGVHISAGPDACADCLVPEPVLRGVLQRTLGVPEGSIDITYPQQA